MAGYLVRLTPLAAFLIPRIAFVGTGCAHDVRCCGEFD
jgi:hypothetical protein